MSISSFGNVVLTSSTIYTSRCNTFKQKPLENYLSLSLPLSLRPSQRYSYDQTEFWCFELGAKWLQQTEGQFLLQLQNILFTLSSLSPCRTCPLKATARGWREGSAAKWASGDLRTPHVSEVRGECVLWHEHGRILRMHKVSDPLGKLVKPLPMWPRPRPKRNGKALLGSQSLDDYWYAQRQRLAAAASSSPNVLRLQDYKLPTKTSEPLPHGAEVPDSVGSNCISSTVQVSVWPLLIRPLPLAASIYCYCRESEFSPQHLRWVADSGL